MSCMLDTNRGTDSVLEHHHMHVTHVEDCLHRHTASTAVFLKHSTYQYVPSTYSGKIVRTEYVLGVKSTYYVCTSTYSYNSNSHFISGTTTLAAVTSLLDTQDAQEHILCVGKVCHRLDILNMGVLTKCTFWVCTWYEMVRTEYVLVRTSMYLSVQVHSSYQFVPVFRHACTREVQMV
jgi:hypothetical protein